MSLHAVRPLPDNAYTRALRGAVPVPAGGKDKLAFQVLMVFCMVTCMVTLNWLIHASDRSLAAFSEVLYEYPLTFVAALFVRTVVTNPLVGRLARAVVPAGLAGFRRTVAMTLVNVSVMVTFMTFFGVLISNGPAGFTWLAYAESLPLSYLLAFSVNLLAVGPFVKVAYAAAVKPGLLWASEKAAELRDKMQHLSKPADGKRARCVTGADIAWVVSARTGIPVGRLTAGERERLLGLEGLLSAQVVGQSKAVSAVAEAVRRGYCGIRDGSRPIACLLFTGPTGVGKTELCRALAQEVYGSRDAMIRLDMTEYMEKQSVSRLIGAPPGYVGYEEGGKLTEAVRRRPYCLVLMDELEKAHPDVLGILLQIMEEGTLTDSTGRHVSFKNAIVVMTSNVGGQIRGDGLGFCAGGRSAEIGEALQQTFSPEFLGRIDQTVCFEPLGAGALEAITWKYLRQLQERTAALGTQLLLPPELAAELLKKRPGKDGARQIRRLVQTEVEGPLASYLLRCGKKPARVKPKLEDGKLVF